MTTFPFGTLHRDTVAPVHYRHAKKLIQAVRDGSSMSRIHSVPAEQESEQLITTAWSVSDTGEVILNDLVAGTPERVVFAGDWHGDYTVAAAVFAYAQAQDADLIVQVGDFGIWPGKDGLKYLKMLERFVEKTGIPVAFVDGNHEDFDQLLAMPLHESGVRPVRPGIVHLPRGFVWEWGDVRLAALGGATSIDADLRIPGRDWWIQEAVRPADLDRLERNVDSVPVDILVTHDTTHRVELSKLGRIPEALQRASNQNQMFLDEAFRIAKPALNLHGHFHQVHDQVVELDGHETTVCSLGKELDSGSVALLDRTAGF